MKNLVVYPPGTKKGQKYHSRGETPQYRQLNTRQIGLFNSSREFARNAPQLYRGLVPVPQHNGLKESGSQANGLAGTMREPDQRPAKLVANPLQPGQLVKLYKGSTGRYSNSLTMQGQKPTAAAAKLWRKLNKHGKEAPNLGV